jgi:hypothetical protein
LVTRTGTTSWKARTGPEAYQEVKELRAVGNHVIKSGLGRQPIKLYVLLDLTEVKSRWTSTDIVRIRKRGESSAPIILWIGVMPASLSGDYGVVVASKCLELLVECDIGDVDVEISESVVTRSAGPKLLTPSLPTPP